jgi:hypothetical protein
MLFGKGLTYMIKMPFFDFFPNSLRLVPSGYPTWVCRGLRPVNVHKFIERFKEFNKKSSVHSSI